MSTLLYAQEKDDPHAKNDIEATESIVVPPSLEPIPKHECFDYIALFSLLATALAAYAAFKANSTANSALSYTREFHNKEKNDENYSFWYREFVIKPYVTNFLAFYETILGLTTECISELDTLKVGNGGHLTINQVVTKYLTEVDSSRSGLISKLDVLFIINQSMGDKISSYLEKLEEELNTLIFEYAGHTASISEQDLAIKIKENRKVIIAELYSNSSNSALSSKA